MVRMMDEGRCGSGGIRWVHSQLAGIADNITIGNQSNSPMGVSQTVIWARV